MGNPPDKRIYLKSYQTFTIMLHDELMTAEDSGSCMEDLESQNMEQEGFDMDAPIVPDVFDSDEPVFFPNSTDHGEWTSSSDDLDTVLGRQSLDRNISTHYCENANINDLQKELEKGNIVYVEIDFQELRETGLLEELWGDICSKFGWDASNPPDHTVVVTQIDNSDKNNPKVIIKDPNRSDGLEETYPLEKFRKAWVNREFHYTATDNDSLTLDDVLNSIDKKYLCAGVAATLVVCITGDPILALDAASFVTNIV